MVHGRGSCDEQFTDLAGQLERHEIATVAINLPGHGHSSTPPLTEPEHWTLKGLAGAVRAVVEHAQLKDFCLFGHSLGGLVALEYGRRYPAPRQLITMGTHVELQSVADWKFALDLALRKWLGDGSLQEWYLRRLWRLTLAEWEELEYLRSEARRDWRRDVAILEQLNRRADYRNVVKAMGRRMTLIRCQDDHIINADLGPSLRAVREAEGRVIELIGGHYSHLLDPRPLATVLTGLLTNH